MYTKTYGNYTPSIYLLSFFIDYIEMNLDFCVRVRVYEKCVTENSDKVQSIRHCLTVRDSEENLLSN